MRPRKISRKTASANLLASKPTIYSKMEIFEKYFNFTAKVVTTFLFFCLFLLIVRNYNEDRYLIKAFYVPDSMDKMGYSGSAFVNAIFVELTKVRKNLYNNSNEGNLRSLSNPTFLEKKSNYLALNEEENFKNDAKIGELSLNTVIQLIKRLFGDRRSEKSISGIVTLDGKKHFVLNMKIAPEDKIIHFEDPSMEGLIHKAAFELIRFQPKAFLLDNAINYYASQSDSLKAEQLALETEYLFSADSSTQKSDWIGLYLAWSNLYMAQKNLEKAETKADILIAKFPKDLAGKCQKILISNKKMLNAVSDYFKIRDIKYQDTAKFYARKTIAFCEEFNDFKGWRSDYARPESAKGLIYFFWSQALSITLDPLHRRPVYDKLLQALKYDPDLALANNDLAYYYMNDAKPDTGKFKEENFQQAEIYIKKALQESPDNGMFLDSYAEFYLNKNDTDMCLKYIDRSLDNQNIYEQITVEDYQKDPRWKNIERSKNYKARFDAILLNWKKHE